MWVRDDGKQAYLGGCVCLLQLEGICDRTCHVQPVNLACMQEQALACEAL